MKKLSILLLTLSSLCCASTNWQIENTRSATISHLHKHLSSDSDPKSYARTIKTTVPQSSWDDYLPSLVTFEKGTLSRAGKQLTHDAVPLEKFFFSFFKEQTQPLVEKNNALKVRLADQATAMKKLTSTMTHLQGVNKEISVRAQTLAIRLEEQNKTIETLSTELAKKSSIPTSSPWISANSLLMWFIACIILMLAFALGGIAFNKKSFHLAWRK